VYVMAPDGSDPIQLTRLGNWQTRFPEWSPDGSQIAFSSKHEGNEEIYVINADGSNLVNLTQHPAIDRWVSWTSSPR